MIVEDYPAEDWIHPVLVGIDFRSLVVAPEEEPSLFTGCDLHRFARADVGETLGVNTPRPVAVANLNFSVYFRAVPVDQVDKR